MTVKALTRLMNDHGTRPRVKVMRDTGDAAILIYEGSPMNMDEETASMKVNSFTVLGVGFLEVHAE